MTGAERQRLYRQRHTRPKPRNARERIVWAVADLFAKWSIILSAEEMDEVFTVFHDHSKVLGSELMIEWHVEAVRRRKDFKQKHPNIANDARYGLDTDLWQVILEYTALRLQEVSPDASKAAGC